MSDEIIRRNVEGRIVDGCQTELLGPGPDGKKISLTTLNSVQKISKRAKERVEEKKRIAESEGSSHGATRRGATQRGATTSSHNLLKAQWFMDRLVTEGFEVIEQLKKETI